ncbi:MAG: hypothetical protein WD969_15085 [Paracoccaceae bacterium]
MRTLHIHIGHGKTGSSYLQSCFALSRDAMAAAGREYPRPSTAAAAAKGDISSGNGRMLINAMNNRLARWLLATRLRAGSGDVVFSSEFLFFVLSRKGAPEKLRRFAQAAGFQRISMLLFIRDPFDHLPSVYQQRVKRGGFTGAIDALTRGYDIPTRCAWLIRAFKGMAEVKLTVRNYSRVRGDLTGAVEEWAGLSAGALARPDSGVVNRSLSAAELTVQRVFNARLGRCGPIVADQFCNLLPDIKADFTAPSKPAGRRMIKRLRADIDFVNAHIDEADRYSLLRKEAEPGFGEAQTVTLTRAQIEAVAAGVAEALKRGRPTKVRR